MAARKPPKPTPIRTRTADAVAEQEAANLSGLGHEAAFASHRARLTAEILQRAPSGGRGRLCLLGAGNGNDVDLQALTAAFAEVHLVDIDAAAVARARERVPEGPAGQGRLVAHAPVDLSGILDRLEAWVRKPPELAALGAEVPAAVARVAARLPGPFDVVVSCCLLTQLQLVLLRVVGDANPRFPELRGMVNAIHVRVLAALLGRGADARALLVTDMTSSDTYPLDELDPDADLRAVMDHLVHVGNLVHAAHPGLLSAEIRRDPALKAELSVRHPVGPWLWRNGPARTYLVYALEIAPLGRLS